MTRELTDLERKLIRLVVSLYTLHGTSGLASFRNGVTSRGIPEAIEEVTGLSVEDATERRELREWLAELDGDGPEVRV